MRVSRFTTLGQLLFLGDGKIDEGENSNVRGEGTKGNDLSFLALCENVRALAVFSMAKNDIVAVFQFTPHFFQTQQYARSFTFAHTFLGLCSVVFFFKDHRQQRASKQARFAR